MKSTKRIRAQRWIAWWIALSLLLTATACQKEPTPVSSQDPTTTVTTTAGTAPTEPTDDPDPTAPPTDGEDPTGPTGPATTNPPGEPTAEMTGGTAGQTTTTTTTVTATTTTTRQQTTAPTGGEDSGENEPTRLETPQNRYFIFSTELNEHLLRQMIDVYGENRHGEYQLAFAVAFYTLTESKESLQAKIHQAFDWAEKYDIACYFTIDDRIGLGYEELQKDPALRNEDNWIFDNVDMLEWYNFPTEEGGTGRPVKFWFNWGSWLAVPGYPCFNSPSYLTFIDRKMGYIIEAVVERYEQLKAKGKEYLFAGVQPGWETDVPDYHEFDRDDPIQDAVTGEKMQPYEFNRTGYHMLYNKGWSQAKLEMEARKQGISFDELWADLIAECQQEYIAHYCKLFYDAGLPRIKIQTHIQAADSLTIEDTDGTSPARIVTAVNQYSVPGFTMSPYMCPYNINILKEKIARADPDQPYYAQVEGYTMSLLDDPETPEIYMDELFSSGSLNVSIGGYYYEDPTNQYYCPRDPAHPFNQTIISYLEQ